MFSEDYLLRIIKQATAVIANIIGLKKAGQYQEALQAIDQALEQLLGMNADLANLLDDESIYKALTTNDILDLDRLSIIAELYKEEGDILSLQKRKPESDNCYLRALNYYLLIKMNTDFSYPTELSIKIEGIIQKLVDYHFSEKTLFDLFCYYENDGKYAKAEKILIEMKTTAEVNADVKSEMISFYNRLMTKSQKELTLGGISRKQIKEKLSRI